MTRNRTRDKVDVFLAKSKEMRKAESETSEGGPTDTESDIQHIDSTWTWIHVEKVLMNLAVFPIWCGFYRRVIGHDESVKAIIRAIRRAYVHAIWYLFYI